MKGMCDQVLCFSASFLIFSSTLSLGPVTPQLRTTISYFYIFFLFNHKPYSLSRTF